MIFPERGFIGPDISIASDSTASRGTFITPGVTGLKVTNGSRVEWLNCFTYFADKGIEIVDGSAGLKGDGKTKIKYSGLSGSAPVALSLIHI